VLDAPGLERLHVAVARPAWRALVDHCCRLLRVCMVLVKHCSGSEKLLTTLMPLCIACILLYRCYRIRAQPQLLLFTMCATEWHQLLCRLPPIFMRRELHWWAQLVKVTSRCIRGQRIALLYQLFRLIEITGCYFFVLLGFSIIALENWLGRGLLLLPLFIVVFRPATVCHHFAFYLLLAQSQALALYVFLDGELHTLGQLLLRGRVLDGFGSLDDRSSSPRFILFRETAFHTDLTTDLANLRLESAVFNLLLEVLRVLV